MINTMEFWFGACERFFKGTPRRDGKGGVGIMTHVHARQSILGFPHEDDDMPGRRRVEKGARGLRGGKGSHVWMRRLIVEPRKKERRH